MKRFFATALLMSVFSMPLSAEPIPADLLNEQNAHCRKECGVMNNEVICRILCDCAMDHFSKAFDKAGLEAYVRQAEAGAFSEENKQITMDTGAACVGQVDIILRSLQDKRDQDKK